MASWAQPGSAPSRYRMQAAPAPPLVAKVLPCQVLTQGGGVPSTRSVPLPVAVLPRILLPVEPGPLEFRCCCCRSPLPTTRLASEVERYIPSPLFVAVLPANNQAELLHWGR